MHKRIFSVLVILGLICSTSVKAQSLQETLSSLSSSVGSAYVKPVISAFGSNLNSGWVSQVPSATKLGLHLDLKIVAMGSFFSSDVKNFAAQGGFYFSGTQVDQILQNSNLTPATMGSANYNDLKQAMIAKQFSVTFSGPTIIGKKSDHLKIVFPGQTVSSATGNYTVQQYSLDVPQVYGYLDELFGFPTAAIQLTAGTVFGTNVAIRYFPDTDIKDLGKFSFFGAGFIHNIGVWFPNPIPLDIGVGFFTQKMKVGNIFESTATQYGIYASKTFGFIVSITPYVGLTMESSKTTVSYNYQSNQVVGGVPVPPVKISFDMDGDNSSSAVIGFNLHLAVVNINADYKFAKTSTASAGVSFGF
ncbi:MAG: hypothetical protein M1495_11165 [Bacteroidetes bacterium]|nr:hypothetical protein [Bacteroidota bacterium]MCL6100281.1 hypothetical protein [Bacteroidota bacterium]